MLSLTCGHAKLQVVSKWELAAAASGSSRNRTKLDAAFKCHAVSFQETRDILFN